MAKMTAQDLHFELIKKATFDEFNGEKVVQDLMSNKELWVGVIMDRLKGTLGDLVTLRDICADTWNADTLYILSSGKDDDKLQKLAEGWQCDNINWWRKRDVFNHIVCYTHVGILVLKWNQNNYYGV